MATHFIQEGGDPTLYVGRPREDFFFNSKAKQFFPEINVFPLDQVRCEPSELHYSTEPRFTKWKLGLLSQTPLNL